MLTSDILKAIESATKKTVKMMPYDKNTIEDNVFYLLIKKVSKTSDNRYQFFCELWVKYGTPYFCDLSLDLLDLNLTNQEAEIALTIFENGFLGLSGDFSFIYDKDTANIYTIKEVLL